MVVLEAFARGVPVVATDLGGTPELVRHGVDGFLVAPDDAAELAAALQTLVDDPARSRAMGKAAYDFAREHLTWRVNARRYDVLYRRARAAAA